MEPEPERQVGPADIIKLTVLVLVRKPHVLIVLAALSAGLSLGSEVLVEQLTKLLRPLAELFHRHYMAAWLATAVGGMVSWGISLVFQGPLVGATIEASSDRAPRGLLIEFLRRGIAHLATIVAITGLTTLFYLAIVVGAVFSLWIVFQVAEFLPPGMIQLAAVVACMVALLFYSMRAALGVSLAVSVALVEETTVIAAMVRSWKLTDGHRYAIAFAALVPMFLAFLGTFIVGGLGEAAIHAYSIAVTVTLLLYMMALGPSAYVVFRDQIEKCRPDQLLVKAAPKS